MDSNGFGRVEGKECRKRFVSVIATYNSESTTLRTRVKHTAQLQRSTPNHQPRIEEPSKTNAKAVLVAFIATKRVVPLAKDFSRFTLLLFESLVVRHLLELRKHVVFRIALCCGLRFCCFASSNALGLGRKLTRSFLLLRLFSVSACSQR